MELEILFALVTAVVVLGGGVYGWKKSRSTKSLPPSDKQVASTRRNYLSLQDALAKTKSGFWGKVKGQLQGQTINSSHLDSLEEALYTSDMGPKAVDQLMNRVSHRLNGQSLSIEQLNQWLKEELEDIFQDSQKVTTETAPTTTSPQVWMVVGVNGAGKTTTIGKLACQQALLGKKVLIAAGDTFRAAADEQLKVWAQRAQVEIFSPEGIKDPSAVAFDAVQKGVAKDFDLIIIDTAGRLHTQKNLMEELKKMKRVMAKALPSAPHQTLLVLDANSGQNALIQTEQFHKALDVTGVILTKMDGSAKGGVAVGIACEHQIPIKMIGVGEKLEDLRPFEPTEFINSIL
jgi:fused signal recognition particle receptor